MLAPPVAIRIRLCDATGVEDAVSVFVRSNLARRGGRWPHRTARIERMRDRLRDPASWFLLAFDDSTPVAMAAVQPLRGQDGAGPVVAGGCFLDSLFVIPERWDEGIGGAVLDAVLDEAKRRCCSRIRLWTHEDNER